MPGTILLIEDEEMVMGVSRALSARLGYIVLKVKTGREAIGKEIRGNDVHMGKTARYWPGPMTSSNSLVVRSWYAKISQHPSRRYYQ